MNHTVIGCIRKIFGIRGSESMIPASQSGNGHGSFQSAGVAGNRVSLTRVLQPANTLRLRPERFEETVDTSTGPEQLSLSSSGLTHTGQVRDRNEDSYQLSLFEDKALFVIADGMGGHDRGELASRTASDAVCRVIREESGQYPADPFPLVERAMRTANREVREQGILIGADMGTTLSVALVSGDVAYIANVGDSRVYWMENGSITQVTTDHSLVAKMVEAGKLTKDEARRHPRANLLYRTIGMDEEIRVDLFRVDLKKGGTLLLCTDGLWGELTDEDIRRVCAENADAESAAARLVQMANERGGRDNITAVVVKVR